MRTRSFRLALGGLAAAGALAVPALAAAPTVTTGPASDVSATTAMVTGTVSSNGERTTYWFEYGTTTGYGSRTADQGPIQGNGNRRAEASLTGLTPSTTHHYRLVASNTSGTVFGDDRTFTTTAPGAPAPGLTAATNVKNVTFGNRVTISGTLTGPGSAGATVTLEQNPAPYTGGFNSTRMTTTTDASGNYAFTPKPGGSVRYRAMVKNGKPITSNEVGVRVKVRVTLGVSDRTPSKGERVRFRGSVYPAHDGKFARLQRKKAGGRWRTVATRALRPATAINGVSRSRYTFRRQVTSTAFYRVRVAPGDGNHIAGNSPRRKLIVG